MLSLIRRQIIDEGRKLLGAPWVHQGRSQTGADCPAPVILPCHALGLSSFDLVNYSRLPDGVELMAICDREMTRIPVASMQPGDAVLLQFGGKPTHIGLLADYAGRSDVLSMIHANNSPGQPPRVVEHRLAHWFDRIVAAYRLPGVDA